MQIIYKSEGLTLKDVVSLTKGNDVQKMSDKKGDVLDFQKVVIYEDVDKEGNPMKVMAVETKDGEKYATNSQVFIRNFEEIKTIFEDSGEALPSTFKVGSGTSKKGRPFITCDLV